MFIRFNYSFKKSFHSLNKVTYIPILILKIIKVNIHIISYLNIFIKKIENYRSLIDLKLETPAFLFIQGMVLLWSTL